MLYIHELSALNDKRIDSLSACGLVMSIVSVKPAQCDRSSLASRGKG